MKLLKLYTAFRLFNSWAKSWAIKVQETARPK